MDRSLSAGVLFVFTAFAAPILAQEQTKSNALKPLTPEASLSLRSISDLQFSADGNHLAFVVTEPPKGERRARHVWVYEKQSGSIRQFTYSGKFESNPRWSPDGKQLAFLSDRDEQLQVYAIRADGGEASALTKGKRGVKNFAWSPDGKQIAFLAPDAKTEPEEKKEKDKDDAHVVDKEDKHARLWLLTLDTGEAKALTEPKWDIREAVWHPSGTGLMLSATDHPESDQNTARIFFFRLWDAVNGARKEIDSMTQLLAPRGPFGNIRIAADGHRWPSSVAARTALRRTTLCLSITAKRACRTSLELAWTGPSLTSAGPRTAGCSPLSRMASIRSSSHSPRKARSRMSPRLQAIQMLSASPIPAKSLLPGKPR